EKGTLGLGERAVGGGDKQHQVRPRYELAREPLVLAMNRIGAGCVDDVEVAQNLDRGGDDPCTGRVEFRTRDLSIPYQLDARRRRRHALLEHALSEQGVDEGTLAGVE